MSFSIDNTGALPASTDVKILEGQSQLAQRQRLDVAVLASSTGDFTHGAGRIQYYSSLTEVSEDFSTTSQPYFWARDNFAQGQGLILAIGRVYNTPQAGFMTTGAVNVDATKAIGNGSFSIAIDGDLQNVPSLDFIDPSAGTMLTGFIGPTQQSLLMATIDGSFTISIDGDEQDITGLDFNAALTLSNIATTIQDALVLIGTGGYTASTVTVAASGNALLITSGTTGSSSSVSVLTTVSPAVGTDISGSLALNGQNGSVTLGMDSDSDLSDIAIDIQTALQSIGSGGFTNATVVVEGSALRIISGTTGNASTVSLMTAGTTGTDVSGDGFLNGQVGQTVNGYTPGDFTSELALISQAASIQIQVYVWSADSVYRDSQAMVDFANYVESIDFGILASQSNDANALDTSITTDLPTVLFNLGLIKTFTIYHSTLNQYPECIAEYLLSVDYAGTDTVRTAKFWTLLGLTTTHLESQDLLSLDAIRCNVYSLVKENILTFREGNMLIAGVLMSARVDLDNLKADLSASLYNMFLTTGKVPFTAQGIHLVDDVCRRVCQVYVTNGSLADITVADGSVPSGSRVQPAYTVAVPNLVNVSAADRADNILRNIIITITQSGAIHSLIVTIDSSTSTVSIAES